MNPSSSSSRRLLLLSRRRHSRSSSSSCRQGRRCLFIADRLQGGGHHDRISGPRFLLRANANTVALTRATATRSFSSSSSSSEGITNNSSNETPYPRLFTPLHLKDCDVLLPNRVLMGSMHTGLEGLSLPGWAAPLLGGKPSSKTNSLDRLAAYAHERAEGGVGLMVTGGIAPDRKGWTGPFSSLLASKSQVDAHRAVTDAVHDVKIPLLLRSTTTTTTGAETESEVPARICLQILHTGRYAYHPFAVSASKTKSPISPFPAKELSLRQIQQTKEAFVRTAVLARQAGYDGVEIMGSEGYLLSQFLAPRTNHRTDRYGSASLEDRARLALEIVEETRTAVGRDFIVVFRLSLLDLVENGLSFDESVQIAQWLEAAGVSIINTGIGWHEARVPTIATNVPRGAFAFPTERLLESNAVSVPLVATNRFNSPETVEALLAEHPDRDLMVSMARPFLADPEWISKSRDGRSDEINTCIACNQACLDHVFVGKVASCLVNPRACHETELPRPSPENLVAAGAEPLKLAVVGSGPAGCAFAVTAAQQGHDVTLYDKSSELGGQFNMAKRIPGKEEFHETLRYFRTLLQKHGVKIRLETEITPSEMRSMTERGDVDRWIVATGVDPRDPGIPGQDHPSVLSYVDVLRRKVPVGRRVAVIGAGGIGFDVSEYLLHHSGGPDKTADEVSKDDFYHEWGIDSTLQVRGGLVQSPEKPAPPDRQIYLLQRKTTKVGAGLGKTTGWIHRATLNNSGAVEMIKGVKKYDKIDENGHLHIIAEDGTPRVLEVDNVVVCAGQVEHRDLEEEAATVDALKDKVYTIGGAYKAGELDAKRAIDMGTRLALKIHDPSVVPGRHVFSAEPGIEESMFQLLKRFM